MRLVRLLAALALALAVTVAGARAVPGFPAWFDFFLVVTLSVARRGRPGQALGTGVAAGWIADALSGGPFGLHGLADSAVGYATALVAQRLVVERTSSLALVFAAGAAVQGGLLAALGRLVVPGGTAPSPLALGVRIATTAAIGVAWNVIARRWSTRRRRRRKSGSLQVPKSLLR